MKCDKMKEILPVWRHRSDYPREYSLNRSVVLSDEEAIWRIKKDYYKDIYMSLYDFGQGEYRVVDKIVLDIDGSMKTAWKKMEKVVNLLQEWDMGESIRVFFSGVGYHVYLYVKDTPIHEVKRKIEYILKKGGCYALVDTKVLGNVRAMIRVPYTVNTKSGLWVVEVTDAEDLDEVVRRAKRRKIMHTDVVDFDMEEVVVEEDKKEEEIIDFSRHNNWLAREINGGVVLKREKYMMPQCIQNLMWEIQETGELDHEKRVLLGMWLVMQIDGDFVKHYFETYANDYDERITEYQVDYLIKKKYRLPGCDKIAEMGLCSRKCKYYPQLSRWIKWKE